MCLLILCGCTTTKYVEVPVEVTKTEYITNIKFDSIYLHDSIDRYLSGDTVFITKNKYIYKQSVKTDTVIKIDSIPKILIQEKEVKVNELNLIQKILIAIGIFSLFVLTIKFIKK